MKQLSQKIPFAFLLWHDTCPACKPYKALTGAFGRLKTQYGGQMKVGEINAFSPDGAEEAALVRAANPTTFPTVAFFWKDASGSHPFAIAAGTLSYESLAKFAQNLLAAVKQ